jgi:hypothetical protein
MFSRPNNASIYLEEAKTVLLEIDSLVIKAYGLSPRVERELLDFFRSPKRGRPVPFEFGPYFPESFSPAIPLWMYISRGFKDCNPSYFAEHAPRITDPELIEALKEAE